MSNPFAAWSPEYPIRTRRLQLRPHVEGDLDDLVEFHGDAEIIRYIPWPVRDRAQTRIALQAKLRQGTAPAEGDWLVLAIVESADDRVIGEVLLKREDDARRIGELGYVIKTSRHGLGFAAEAASAMIEYAFGTLNLHTVVAHVDSRNVASERLLLRLGFTPDPRPDEDSDARPNEDTPANPDARPNENAPANPNARPNDDPDAEILYGYTLTNPAPTLLPLSHGQSKDRRSRR